MAHLQPLLKMFDKNTSIKYSRKHFLWSLGLILSLVSMAVCGSTSASELNYLPGWIRLECQDSYSPGETVQVKLFVINTSSETATYGMTYNVKIYDAASNVIWTKDVVVYGKVIVAPGDEAALPDFVWDQKDKDGLQVNSGQYKIAVKLWEGDIAGEKIVNIGEGQTTVDEEQEPVPSRDISPTTEGSTTPQPSNIPGRIRLECQDSYSPGENVKAKLFVANPSSETATYGMTYNAKIYDIASNLIWTKDFVVYGKVIVAPGDEAALPDFVWDQKDKDGLQVTSGDYRIAIQLWQSNIAGEKTITIQAEEAKTSGFVNFLKRLKIFNWFLEHWR